MSDSAKNKIVPVIIAHVIWDGFGRNGLLFLLISDIKFMACFLGLEDLSSERKPTAIRPC